MTRFTTFQRDPSVTALAERLFELPEAPDRRKEVEDALAAANPHLADLKRVPDGAVVVVPRVPGIRLREQGDLIDQALDEAIEAVGQALADVRASVGASAEDRVEEARATLDLARAEPVVELGRANEHLARLIPMLTSGAERVIENAEEQRSAEHQALERVEAELKAFLGGLRG